MMHGFIEAPIVDRREWAPGLMTIRLAAQIHRFEPGQFVNLTSDVTDPELKRPYSLASAPGEAPEFYVTRVDDGSLTPRLFDLPLGARLWIEQKPQGFFTLKYVPECRDLWLVATGTGLGPFIAMLRSGEPWTRFERVVAVHGVRHAAELGYKDELTALADQHPGRFIYVPIVSRDPGAGSVLHGRVTSAYESGELERAAVPIAADTSHLMLCGNPDMIRDMTELLHGRGLRKHRMRQPGHYTIEKYW